MIEILQGSVLYKNRVRWANYSTVYISSSCKVSTVYYEYYVPKIMNVGSQSVYKLI